MKVYLDLIFFMNFYYDFILLFITSKILKRNFSLKRILIASLIGSLSIFLLFLSLGQILNILISFVISIIMLIISFGYNNLIYTFNNIIYLYMESIIMAGFNQFLSNYLNLSNILLIILTPGILYYLIRMIKGDKTEYYLKVDIVFDKTKISCMGFLDSGNFLIDPISKKPVIILKQKYLMGINNIRSPVYVPFNTVSDEGLMKCYKPSYILINNHKMYNYLIGEGKMHFKDGIGCLLNNKLLEEINV